MDSSEHGALPNTSMPETTSMNADELTTTVNHPGEQAPPDGPTPSEKPAKAGPRRSLPRSWTQRVQVSTRASNASFDSVSELPEERMHPDHLRRSKSFANILPRLLAGISISPQSTSDIEEEEDVEEAQDGRAMSAPPPSPAGLTELEDRMRDAQVSLGSESTSMVSWTDMEEPMRGVVAQMESMEAKLRLLEAAVAQMDLHWHAGLTHALNDVHGRINSLSAYCHASEVFCFHSAIAKGDVL